MLFRIVDCLGKGYERLSAEKTYGLVLLLSLCLGQSAPDFTEGPIDLQPASGYTVPRSATCSLIGNK